MRNFATRFDAIKNTWRLKDRYRFSSGNEFQFASELYVQELETDCHFHSRVLFASFFVISKSMLGYGTT